MKILVILAHPSPQSFNHAIASTVCRKLTEMKHEIIFHDLYAENFNPLLGPDEILKEDIVDDTIRKHCEDLVNADGIVIIHPNWWGTPPAILKGWIDRVIRPGIAYEFLQGDTGEGTPVGLLKTKTALVFNTSNTNKEREDNIFLDPLETIWKNCVFYLCGVKVFYRKMFRILATSSEKQRKQWLSEAEQIIIKYFD
jgi:NAD(P)H dehydrogenase (quinone)